MRHKNTMRKISRVITNGITVVSVIGMLWIGLSWAEVIIKQHTNHTYSDYNVFVLFQKSEQ